LKVKQVDQAEALIKSAIRMLQMAGDSKHLRYLRAAATNIATYKVMKKKDSNQIKEVE
jgi:hypothetical protein